MQLDDQPAFVLHRRAFGDTSQIVELLTRDHGRVAALAKGSRRGSQNKLRCEPFQCWHIDLRGRGDLPLLTRVEPAPDSAPLQLKGMASLAGLYLNELLLALLQRDDPHAALFGHYAHCLSALTAELAFPLRRFEWQLLCELGYAPDLSFDEQGLPLDSLQRYEFSPDSGLQRSPVGRFSGVMLQALADGSRDQLDAQRRFLREQFALHLDYNALRSWQLLRELEQVMPAASR